jgi:hypothetical protein
MQRICLHPLWFALLAFLTGLGLGIAGARSLEDYLEYRERRSAVIYSRQYPRRRMEAIQRAESLAAQRDTSMRYFRLPPMEVERAQVSQHCAITYAFTKGSEIGFPLLSARADDPHSLEPVGQAWAYKRGGFQIGDTVTIVIPNANCGATVVSGWSWGLADPPLGPARLLVR